LTSFVSSRLRLTNLGWVVHDPLIHKANCERRPILLQPPLRSKERPVDAALAELARLESTVLGLPEPAPARAARQWDDEIRRVDGQTPVARQLEILNRMYKTTGQMHVRDNFAYIAHRAIHLIRNQAADSFGQTRLFTPIELFEQLFPDAGPASA